MCACRAGRRIVLLPWSVVMLRVQVEERFRRTWIWLGAFSKSEHFVRLEARLSSTGVELELLVVLGLDDIPAHHLGHLLNSVVQGGGSGGILKLFSLSLHQQLVVFVLVIELAGPGGRGATLATRPLLNGDWLASGRLLAAWCGSSLVRRGLGSVLGGQRVLVWRAPFQVVGRGLVDGLLASWQ